MDKPLKIAIIAHSCRAGGGLVATKNLLGALKSVVRNEKIFLVYSKGYGYETIKLPENSDVYVYDGSHTPLKRYLFEERTLPAVVSQFAPDVIFGPGPTALSNPRAPQSLFMRNPYLFYPKDCYPHTSLYDVVRTWALRRHVKKSLPHTQMIFAQTPVVKARFAGQWNYPEENIKVLRFPVPADVQPNPNCPIPEPLKQRSGAFTFLVLTRYLAHRNPEILLPLCLKYKNEFRKSGVCFITTLGQDPRTLPKRFLRRVNKLDLQDLIVDVGYLNREQVVQYYTHCRVLWLHTLMETLCLPFLEAMTMRLPILAPEFDFSRYVCGTAAQYYDPWDVDSLFENLMTLRQDAALRQTLIENGHQEIRDPAKFSNNWEEVAVELLKNLHRLADSGKK
jgi:glycosyltransferase involved in cell wall biosynthesis